MDTSRRVKKRDGARIDYTLYDKGRSRYEFNQQIIALNKKKEKISSHPLFKALDTCKSPSFSFLRSSAKQKGRHVMLRALKIKLKLFYRLMRSKNYEVLIDHNRVEKGVHLDAINKRG